MVGSLTLSLAGCMYALSTFSSPLPPPRRTRPDRQHWQCGRHCLVSHDGLVPGGDTVRIRHSIRASSSLAVLHPSALSKAPHHLSRTERREKLPTARWIIVGTRECPME
ncbi:uncharacterized protein ASPGLDRAFT_471650 [Aspergillus glaucus CBS 516.65]|uniref:Secreted protein n=1 Tax=Aspergillus glaucus CBS 516.65 TaxID=1160497 RepID=A0A1L9VH52_ASPGL|nr:hypothetical protein ASPGLDRAFT_471650 [Aspergillus glaucus CBS 516.65]OJJ83220.1 hypothetical protein ASPGLDRAFT_471650 [Aspergillus glaucus CBS 516.65]